MTTNALRQRLTGGGTALGAFVMTDGVFNAETLGHAGFDYVCVDVQHGLMGYQQMLQMLQAISATSATPIVRVPELGRSTIERALDAGALAIIVPMVETAEQAAAAVSSCRYPPNGARSYGPTRAGLALGPGTGPADVGCYVMVETETGLGNVKEICSVPGLDGVYVGPSDLALTLGSPLFPKSDRVYEAVTTIREACDAAGITPGIHGGTGAASARFLAEGFRMVTVTQDYTLIGQMARTELEAAQAGPPTA